MTFKNLRYAAVALGFGVVFGACDATSTAVRPDNNNPPKVTISVEGLDRIRMRVPYGSPIRAKVSASDDISLLRVYNYATRDSLGYAVSTVDSTVFSSATPGYTSNLTLNTAGARSGDTVRVYANAMDGRGAIAGDSLKFIIFDSVPPLVTLQKPTRTPIRTLKSGSPTDTVLYTSSDSSGLVTSGYDILTLSGGVLTVVHQVNIAEYNRPTRSTQLLTPDFGTLAPGAYLIRARATDATGITALSDTVRFNIADAIPPVADIFSPTQGAPLLVGDSIDVRTALSDNVALKRFVLKGFSVRGDPAFGATDTVTFYDSVVFNYTSLKTVDTLTRRLRVNARPFTAQDTVMWFRAIITDLTGNADTALLRTIVVSGPKVIMSADSVAWPNKEVTVTQTVIDSTPAIDRYGYRATLSSGVVVKDTTILAGGAQNVTTSTTFIVPSTVTIGATITIVPRATDAGGNLGSGNTLVVKIIAEPADATPPIVYQSVPPRFEQGEILRVDAKDPSQIRALGYEMRTLPDSVLIGSATLSRAAGTRRTNDTAYFAVQYDRSHRGKKAFVIGWAEDSLGNRGYTIMNSATTPLADPSLAKRDTALLVYGVTYRLPTGSFGADIAVDTNATRKRVFVSDVRQGGLFVWEDSSATRTAAGFRPTKISVGAFPWGMALDTSGNKLFVANSGGTNIDVVDLNTLTDIRGARVQTPSTALFDVAWFYNQTTGVYKLGALKLIQYSDRPQYVAQSQNGNLYFSTRPTPAAPEGTIRRIDDPLGPGPRPRQVWQYGSGKTQNYSFFNADSVQVVHNPPAIDDVLRVCDTDIFTKVSHCSGWYVFASSATADLFSRGTFDEETVYDLDVLSLALPDTNFVASGADGRRIMFGEGATSGAPGRVFTVIDTLGMTYSDAIYSRPIQIRDLVNNASDQIFGVAVNQKSNYFAIHGSETFFADTGLRLQGKYGTAARGAGIAFNPGNDDKYAADAVSQAFVASADSTIEVVDSYYFRLRQKLPLRTNLYGALRVWYNFNPIPGVPLRIYGLTQEGLVVIDVRPEDIVQLP